MVKNDKIVEAVFPPDSMGIKRDEQDGSVYVMLTSNNPFTLFLTTEAGHHFSATVSGEESLGKTIEILPQQVVTAKTAIHPTPNQTSLLPKDGVSEKILTLLTQMQRHEPQAQMTVKHHYGKVDRWSKGLALIPKESWIYGDLKGEIIELYNVGKEPLTLSQEWFAVKEIKAVQLSKTTLAPHERALLYRVQGVGHG